MSVWSRNEKWQQESGSPSKEHTEEDGRKKGQWKERRRGRKIDMTGCLFKILHIKYWHSLFNYETVWTISLVSLGWSQYALLRPNKFEYVYVQRILWRVEGWGGVKTIPRALRNISLTRSAMLPMSVGLVYIRARRHKNIAVYFIILYFLIFYLCILVS